MVRALTPLDAATSTTTTAHTTARLVRNARATDPRAPHTRYLPQGATRMSDEMYRMPSGEVRYFNAMGAPPINEGALSVDEILDMEGELAARVQEALWPHFPKIEACKREMIDRGGVIERDATMTLALRVVGNGATVRITEIRAVESLWPVVFDEPARHCTMLAFANVEFAWTRVVDLVLDYQVGFTPDKPAKPE